MSESGSLGYRDEGGLSLERARGEGRGRGGRRRARLFMQPLEGEKGGLQIERERVGEIYGYEKSDIVTKISAHMHTCTCTCSSFRCTYPHRHW